METLQKSLHDFIIYISSEKGLAQNSVDAYRRDILSFITYLQTLGIDSFPQVTSAHIIDFLAHRRNAEYASASICRALIAIKVLFHFLRRERIITVDIALHLDSPKLWQLIPEVLNHSEIEHLLAQPDISTAQGARDKAILEVLYGCGLRVSEVCNLKLYAVDDQFIRVMGKGSKERTIPIGKQAIIAIDHYLSNHRDH